MNKLPTLFNYKEENADSGYEAIQDFFLSWTLRCSKEIYKKNNFLINYYAKKLIHVLICGKNDNSELKVSEFDSFSVLEIKTRRQFKGIDLIVKAKVLLDGKEQNFILNIENKWYTTIRETQLRDYPETIRENYNLEEAKLINWVIFCDEDTLVKHPHQIELCKKYGYSFTNIDELSDLAGMSEFGTTGNALFDEYWFHGFNPKYHE